MYFYEIRVRGGHLNSKRLRTFDGLGATLLPAGETVLAGQVVDQAALHGILRQINDLGLTLILVQLKEFGITDLSK